MFPLLDNIAVFEMQELKSLWDKGHAALDVGVIQVNLPQISGQ
jgi:hypothetical protein